MKAILITFSLTTRLIVDDNISEDEIIQIGALKCSEKLSCEPNEHLDSIIDDVECPFDPEFDIN